MEKPARRRSDAKNAVLLPDDTDAAPVDRVQIAHRAFELFCARGCHDRHDVDDWLRAERELSDNHERTPHTRLPQAGV